MSVQGNIRRIVFSVKRPIGNATKWSNDNAPQRLTPFSRSMKLPSDKWQWRSLRCASEDREFILFSRVSYDYGNYQAWLLLDEAGSISLVARLEDHSSHAGLHAHCSCGDELPIVGSQSINTGPDGHSQLYRIPETNSSRQGECSRRTVQGESPDDFFNLARMIFRIETPSITQGELKV